MEQMLKQRLIGAVVLVSLAVIFIPMLLDGAPDSKDGITGSNIPLKPFKIESDPVRPVSPLSRSNNAGGKLPAVDTRQESSPVHQGSKITPKPAEKGESKLKSWVVQLGSFSDKQNALNLRKKLRKSKYNAFIEESRTSAGKSSFRVRVGPELDEKRAGRIQKKLLSELKLKGVVLRYR